MNFVCKAQDTSPAEDEQRRRQQQEREQVRQSLLSRILSPEARQRCRKQAAVTVAVPLTSPSSV